MMAQTNQEWRKNLLTEMGREESLLMSAGAQVRLKGSK